MKKLKNIHPGDVLKEEFLTPLGISAYRLCMDIGVPQTRISEILKGNRSITADTALRLSKYFGNTPNFWLGLQNDFDIEEELLLKGSDLKILKDIRRIKNPLSICFNCQGILDS
jgi:addiction module HigA family antidote